MQFPGTDTYAKIELGVLLANRSAAFYHMECYLQALRDCDEALKVGYPNHLLYKLEERRARCLLALKCHAKAIESFKAAIMALDEAKVPKERKKKIEADMRVMLTLMIKGEELNEKQGLTKRMQVEIENERFWWNYFFIPLSFFFFFKTIIITFFGGG